MVTTPAEVDVIHITPVVIGTSENLLSLQEMTPITVVETGDAADAADAVKLELPVDTEIEANGQ